MDLSSLENWKSIPIKGLRFHRRKYCFDLYLSCYPSKNAGTQNKSVGSPIFVNSLNSSKYITALEDGKKIAGSQQRSGS